MSLTLRYPFLLGVDRLSEMNAGASVAHAGIRFSLGGADGKYWIEAEPLPTMEEAERLCGRIWLGLMLYQLSSRRRIVCTPTIARVVNSADTEGDRGLLGLNRTAYGVADGALPCAYETGRRPAFTYVGEATASVSTPASRLLSPVAQATSHRAEAALGDTPLRTAIDLFSLSLAQADTTARFLSTIMGIESLTTPADRHPLTTQLLTRWREEVASEKSLHREDSDEWKLLADLEREVLFRNKASIRSRVRRLVLDTLAADADVEELSRRTVKAYDRRSALVHTGTLSRSELLEAERDAAEALGRLLLARIASAAPTPNAS